MNGLKALFLLITPISRFKIAFFVAKRWVFWGLHSES